MSSGTDALYGFAAHDPRRQAPETITRRSRALPQSILANVALAFVAATCVWTVWSHVTTGEVALIAAERLSPPPTAAPAPARPTIQESFAALQPSTAVRRGYSGLFDARHLSSTPPTLLESRPAALAGHLLAPVATVVVGQHEAAAPQPPTEPPTGRSTAQRVPVPAPRPVALASLQDPAAAAPPLAQPKAVVEDKATVLALISSNKNSLFNRLFGKPRAPGTALAYASADGGIGSEAQTILFDGMPKYDQWTAVYDISARKVYMPDGSELEAHSGLGKKMDDPRYVHVKMHGATPPHVYNLSMREALFHGDEALRMTPIGGDGRIFGRRGLLTHSYLLGPRGDSNGCVSFKDYNTFLQAYKKGLVKRMVVVAKLG